MLLASLAVIGGCNQGGPSELNPDQDKELRNNLSRELTPEELAQMGKSAPASANKGDAGPAATPPPGKGPR